MGKRQRIINEIIGQLVPEDSEAFTQNKCSVNARKVHTNSESIEFDIWFDKHYYIREHHGDEDGKREGIDPDVVQALIVNSAKHLIYYSIRIPAFSFVNFTVVNRPERIVLRSDLSGELSLNIVAEYHYLNLNRYEVTVKTAIRKDDFHFSDGQYMIEIYEDRTSRLFRKERGKIKEVSNCP